MYRKRKYEDEYVLEVKFGRTFELDAWNIVCPEVKFAEIVTFLAIISFVYLQARENLYLEVILKGAAS